MSELVHIGNSDISIKEYNGQRVVTFKDIDMVHGRPDGTAKRNFNANKYRFVNGEDYFVVSADEIRTSLMFPISDNDFMSKILITEQGYLMLVKSFTDDLAWEVQRQLVSSYFKVRTVADDLSPQMKMLYAMCDQMAQAERQANEAKRIADNAKETASKAVESVENIKEAVRPVFDNWREEINAKFNRIQKSADKPFNVLRTEMYSELESRAGCDLNTRLRNKKSRMADAGCTKTEINNLNKMDIIEENKQLREIFSKIVTEYEIKYCA